ncbi:hypothetical protein BN14_07646 [Rhizoctonia solani AG-1 IB]|uniref:Uncharacterized protein n=1 Tax=Thanatephorus cucumeris (strain AG1-IB / isolate 7/3/14) TaxID=1108050 RepID=M5C0T1_THACB|nr:hypothetical protein BN14_07646 [Rhizoctonia solani AG-1 IB]
MNPQQDELGSAYGPLIDYTPDINERAGSGLARPSLVVQEPTTPERDNPTSPETPVCTSPLPPARSIRELVQFLGSPVHSDSSSRASVVSRPASNHLGLSSLSPFDDPFSFGNQPETPYGNQHEAGAYPYRAYRPHSPSASVRSILSTTPPEQDHTPERSDRTNVLNIQNEASTFLPFPSAPASSPFNPTHVTTPHDLWPPLQPQTPTAHNPTSSRLPALPNFSNARQSSSRRPRQTYTPTPHTSTAAPLQTSSYPWNQSITDPFGRPDRFSRTTAHTTISDILFNFDLDPSSAAELIEDACLTARQVGVSTQDLLSRSVFLGTSDLGMTPLCLEASRVDVGAGLELVLWLIENTSSAEVEGQVRKGCLMRCNGMGEQGVWGILRGFIPDAYVREKLAYDVDVEGLAVVPAGAFENETQDEIEDEDEDDSDEGSLYDDISIVDAESSYVDQADIETLKSSSDERDQEPGNQAQEEPPCRVHRARIVLPMFTESLTGPSWSYTSPSRSNRFGMASSGGVGNKRLTAEWMFEGRIWALSVGEDSLLVTLSQTSSAVSSDPVRVKVLVRIIPLDMYWSEMKPIERIGSDRLLPTEMPSDVLLSSPLYEWESEEQTLIPGLMGVGSSSSIWKTEIRASEFSILELVGNQSGVKVEVVVRVREICVPSGSSVAPSVVDDASDWQFVDN